MVYSLPGCVVSYDGLEVDGVYTNLTKFHAGGVGFLKVCAAGALLNILGPDMGEEKDSRTRKGFGKLITSCLVLGMCYDGLFDLNARDELLA